MKKTENKKLFESMVFDNYAYAQSIYEESNRKLVRIRIGLIISAIATSVSLYCSTLDDINTTFAGIMLLIAILGGLTSYIVGGGIKIALRAVKKLALIGWFILPFPYDLATGLFTLCVAPVFFIFVPFVFVLINFIQVKRNRDDAAEYMNFCRPTNKVIYAEI